MIKVEVISSNGTIPEVTNGVEQDVEVVVLQVVVSKSKLDTDAYNFDPSSASSPPASESRAYARPIVEAYIAKLAELNP